MFRVEPRSPARSRPVQTARPPQPTKSGFAHLMASGAFAVVSLVLLISLISAFVKPATVPAAGVGLSEEPVARVAFRDPPLLASWAEDTAASPVGVPAENSAPRTSRPAVLRTAATKPLPPATTAARRAPPPPPPVSQARQVQQVPQLSSTDVAPVSALTPANLSAPQQEHLPAALVTPPKEPPLAASSTPATTAIPPVISDTAAIESRAHPLPAGVRGARRTCRRRGVARRQHQSPRQWVQAAANAGIRLRQVSDRRPRDPGERGMWRNLALRSGGWQPKRPSRATPVDL